MFYPAKIANKVHMNIIDHENEIFNFFKLN